MALEDSTDYYVRQFLMDCATNFLHQNFSHSSHLKIRTSMISYTIQISHAICALIVPVVRPRILWLLYYKILVIKNVRELSSLIFLFSSTTLILLEKFHFSMNFLYISSYCSVVVGTWATSSMISETVFSSNAELIFQISVWFPTGQILQH